MSRNTLDNWSKVSNFDDRSLFETYKNRIHFILNTKFYVVRANDIELV